MQNVRFSVVRLNRQFQVQRNVFKQGVSRAVIGSLRQQQHKKTARGQARLKTDFIGCVADARKWLVHQNISECLPPWRSV